MAVIFKGSFGPLCSSPTAKGVDILFLTLLIWGRLNIGADLLCANLLMTVTKVTPSHMREKNSYERLMPDIETRTSRRNTGAQA